jgi:hypothetical protein
LNKFDGIITRAAADPNVVDVPNVGVITKANVADIVADVWAAIPEKFFENPDYIIHMNTTDYRLLQEFNNDAKKTTVGVLDEQIRNLFLNHRIQHYSGLPKNSIVGALTNPASDQSNLFLGYYVEYTNENPRINYVENAGREMFVRLDLKADANYRVGSEIILYQGV